MSPLFSPTPGTKQLNDQSTIDMSTTYVVSVPRVERWQVYYRLRELMIPCWCLPDGSLRVEVQNGMHALLLRSVVQQFIASRQEMVTWLGRCWNARCEQKLME